MRMLISDMAGRANIQIKGEQLGHDLSDRETAARVTDRIKDREAQGYSYEAADASFDLLLRDELGQLDRPFTVEQWRVFCDQTDISEAILRVSTKGEASRLYAGDGNGPVNALDMALRTALEPAFPHVADFELTDYRVRILDTGHGTDAIVRVLIDTRTGGRGWTTVGVGSNVIEASYEALVDAYLYGIAVLSTASV
jgi:2-isopropylmalate synthase